MARPQPGLRSADRPSRVALTGIHLLRTGELVTSVLNLYSQYGFPNVAELVELKHAREAGTISQNDEARYLEDLPRLEAALENAAAVRAAGGTRNRDELEQFVIEERVRV